MCQNLSECLTFPPELGQEDAKWMAQAGTGIREPEAGKATAEDRGAG